MSMLLHRSSKMGNPFFNEFKRQASFFLKEKIKTARLVLTDVTPAELLTEEATNGDLWPPDTRTMAVISRAAFEVDDYWRIVDILHKRFTKFDGKTWRVSYKSLLLLEHLLTHGPLRVSDEFQTDREVIKEMGTFQLVDEKGFNWGMSVKNLSARILKLLESEVFLKEDRARARKLTQGIQGFGSFSHRSPSHDGSFTESNLRMCLRCNSNYDYQHNQDYEFLASDGDFSSSEKVMQKAERLYEVISSEPEDGGKVREEDYTVEDHPFCYSENQTTTSFLSTLN